MSQATSTLPATVKELQSLVVQLQAEKEDYKKKYLSLRKDLFGKKSEKISVAAAQDHLFNEAEKLNDEKEKSKTIKVKGHRRKRKPKRDSIPAHIERKEIRHDIENKTCTCCGKELKHIGDDLTERLNVIPERIYAEKHVYPKYRCSDAKCIRLEEGKSSEVISAPRNHFLKSAIVSATLLARIIIKKYLDSLPLYRQEGMFRRHDIQISRQSLANWVIQGYKNLEIMKEFFMEDLVTGKCILIDESVFQVLRENTASKNHKYYIWHMRASPPPSSDLGKTAPSPGYVAYYEYQPSRSTAFLEDHFKNYKGSIVSDGWSSYNVLAKKLNLGHGGCWAHARRKFYKAWDQDEDNKDAQKFIALIGDLFKLEEINEEQEHINSLKFRDKFILPVIDQIDLFMKKTEGDYPGTSYLGEAISYTKRQWVKLTYFLQDENVPIHNNETENGIRPFVVGRKNWLFAVSPKGANASALWYSLIQTAIANDLNPEKYLIYLFEHWQSTKNREQQKALMPNRVDKKVIEEFYEVYGQV